MFQYHYQSLRPLTTAHLAQTMTLLSQTVDELRQQIESELSANPALELIEERYCPHCHRLLPGKGSCPVCSRPQNASADEPVVFISPSDDFYVHSDATTEDLPEDIYSSSAEELPAYVLRQIGMELEPQDRIMAAYLLTHLDEDGLLTIPLVEIAHYYHVPVSRIENIRHMIQHADPVGVGSSTTQEALLVQLEVLAETRPIPNLARIIIEKGMDLLCRHQYAELAHDLKVSLRQIKSISQFISDNLNPFPARSHYGDARQPAKNDVQVYHRPDIIISFLNDDPNNSLVIEIILPINGTLRVNPLFRQAIQQADTEKKDAWKSDLDRASLFVKCLQQRNNTMQRLLFRVAVEQKGYIVFGEEYLKPMTRAQFAKELEVHESTISRAVASKTVQLPNKRIIPLSSFFDRSLNVRTVLKDMISKEARPLSDTELATQLAKRGYLVARRTVAKYRSMEGILPAHLRQSHSHPT
jgi:RNA polymerase sigma-54 factor